jgi:hypothetical protein
MVGKTAWKSARARVYEAAPLASPEGGSRMKVVAGIQGIDRIKHNLSHDIKTDRARAG